MDKMKVVWLCHFSNFDVQKRLDLNRGLKYSEFAPWITNLIREFQQMEEVDLYIIAPHAGMKKMTQSFTLEGVHYNFYNPYIPFCGRGWPRIFAFDRWSKYRINRILVKKIMRKIQPDVVHLFGAENPYYSIAALDVKDIPLIETVQGIYSNPERFKKIKEDKLRSAIERAVHRKCRYYIIGANFFPALIRRDCPSPKLYNVRLPIKRLEFSTAEKPIKKYDFIFWARMTKLKGAEDVLDALSLVKEKYPDVTLRMMGECNPGYFARLKDKINGLGIQKNVLITGEAVSSHTELLREGSKGRIYILPTYLDTIPGTIVEATNLGLPVISYNTGDIPLFNREGQSVLLCEAGDIEALADNMILLLKNPSLQGELNRKAKEFISEEFDNEKNARKIVGIYHSVLKEDADV